MADTTKRELDAEEYDLYFLFTEEQRQVVCRHFGKDIKELQTWEVEELLDKVIDNLEPFED